MSETDAVVEIRDLSRKFGKTEALKNITLTVPPGCVFGLIGENGAGKTTIIKHILGLLKAQYGTVRVFGSDPVVDPVGVLSRIGYLSEESDIPGWMRIDELMRYSQAFYPTWDQGYAEQLCREFAMQPNLVIKNLSKGQRARAGLLIALAYHPDLLLLDEPSSGLDPLVRRDIMGAIVRTIADDGRTVLFSSHLLGEVERVADYVAMIRGGRIVFSDSMESIKSSHFRVTFRFESQLGEAPFLNNALKWEGSGREWTAIYNGSLENAERQATVLGATIVYKSSISLEEIFIARAAVTATL